MKLLLVWELGLYQNGWEIKKYYEFKKELIKKFSKNISSNINLSNYSWFNLGGPAEYLFKPENKAQLIEFLKNNKKYNLK